MAIQNKRPMIVNKRPMIGFTPFGSPLEMMCFWLEVYLPRSDDHHHEVIAMFCGSTNWLIRIRIGKQIKIRG